MTDARKELVIVEWKYLKGLTQRAAWFWLGWFVAAIAIITLIGTVHDMKKQIDDLKWLRQHASELDSQQRETAKLVEKSSGALIKAWEQQTEAIKTIEALNDSIGIVATSKPPSGTYSKR